MMVSNEGNALRLLQWQGSATRFYLGTATGWWLVHQLGFTSFDVPAWPLAIVGGAIGIFTSFRTNSAYDRWWEGRKLWGRLVNLSRHLGDQLAAYVTPKDAALSEELLRRHVLWMNLLRVQLRSQDPWADPEVARLLTPDDDALRAASTPTFAVTRRQHLDVAHLADLGALTEHRLQQLDGTLLALLDVQGGCERIKGTPLPRGYGYIAELLIQSYAVLLPLALVPALGWVAIPLNLLVCMAFRMINEAGRVLEDPFTMFWNGLPLSYLCRKIERDIRSEAGHTDLPSLPTVTVDGILM